MHVKIILLTVLGFVFLGFGAIGVFLPVWPTTPFVLLSVACFSSSPRIKAWIMKNPFFREHVENYEKRTGLTKKTVWISLLWLWSMMIISIVLVKSMWIMLILFFIGIAITTHILWISRSATAKEIKKN